MEKVNGCVIGEIVLKGETYKRIKYGEEEDNTDIQSRCHDCGAKRGHYHHFRCDVEQCPRCKGQLLSCDCLA
jgi:hypothetical protein